MRMTIRSSFFMAPNRSPGCGQREWVGASSLPAGGVRRPGGAPRLQSGWDGRSPSGGFDSRPPPRKRTGAPPRGRGPRKRDRLLRARLDGEEVARAGVARGVAQLRHGPGLDLADALAGQVEVLADLLERAGLAAVEAEAQLEDLALPLVERGQQPGDLLGEEGGGGDLERRLRRPVLDHVAELGVAV